MMETPTQTTAGVVVADQRLRKRAIVVVWALAAAGVLAIAGTEAYLQSLRELARLHPQQAIGQAVFLLKLVVLACSTGCFGFGLYLLLLARRILAAEQFPPPGMLVLRDTPIVSGQAAEKQAKLFVSLAAILIAAGIALIPLTMGLIARLMRP